MPVFGIQRGEAEREKRKENKLCVVHSCAAERTQKRGDELVRIDKSFYIAKGVFFIRF
jgi:hypothetical protein